MNSYQKLEKIFARQTGICNASAILQWDNATVMPQGSGESRAEQLTILAELAHETITSPELPDLFNNAQMQKGELDQWQQANLHEMQRIWQHATALPTDLVAELTKAGHESELFWRSARKENDFKGFAPYQKRVLQLVRESAQAKSSALGLSPYDALIDQYDPGTKSDFIDGIFNDLADFLPEFTGQVIERQKSQTPPLQINDNVSKAAQKELGIEFMQKLGFDFSQGRLDESTHPFCGGVVGDVRITTRYDEKDFLSGFFGVMHETGHALYEMHLPKELRMQPVGQARGMAFHESQSLFTEMQLCIRKEFLQYAAPYMRKTLNKNGDEWHEDNIYKLMTQVTPSFIRVDADEVTYPAHIILRYRLERQLIDGTLEVEDLPDAWNEQMRLLLGIVPDNYANGCMQDIHWTDGSFGYFPSYTLGAMIAAQLFNSIEKAIPEINSVIRNGEFRQIYSWLHQNVHCLGSKYSSQDLLLKASGENLNINYYKNHLKTRYLAD